ncbi:MAG TPA: ABC transporter permease subunit [Casimicrobiaceae bacterium]|nr:ABC transporter permease subunit [Casimicrobiaceae bacterium]
MKRTPKALYRLLFVASVLLVWWLASTVLFPTVIPTVGGTLRTVWELLTGTQFYQQLWVTTQRVLLGFAIAFVAGLAIGTAMGRSKAVEAFFEMFIVIGTSQPGLFVSMIFLVALGLSSVSAVITLAYLATPIITVSIWQGAKRMDVNLEEVATVFGYSRVTRIRHVVMPQLAAPALSAVRTGLGITWKYVVMIEMLGLTDGVGYEVARSFQLFQLQSVIAWTICFLTFVLLVEYLVIRTIERRIYAWRDRAAGALQAPDTLAEDASLVANA